MVMREEHTIEDAFIPLGDGTFYVDAGLFFAGLLSTEWDANNTDSIKPKVILSEEGKTIRFVGNDYITVYVTSSVDKNVGVSYKFKHETETISLDIFSSQDRRHFNKLIQECERVVQARNTDTYDYGDEGQGITGRVWTEWGIRKNPYDKTGKGYYRRVIDCRVNWRFRRIRQ